MKVKILGGHGGQAPGCLTTSILIDNILLIDAGAVAATLHIQDQVKIDHILISHAHLDHIKDLAFICDNCFGLKNKPFEVYTHSTVKNIIKSHLLNDIVWPDFTILPSESNPTITIHSIAEEIPLQIGKYTILPVRVNHAHDAMGFIITKNDVSLLFTQDTGPTERIWEIAHTIKNLKAIFTEVSFPDRMLPVAQISDHHTPMTLRKELEKMPKDIPVIITHLKPNFQQEISLEISSMGESRINVLSQDGQEFYF